MQVVQTDGPPPNQGRIILLTIGWTWNNKKALMSTVAAAQPVRSSFGGFHKCFVLLLVQAISG